MLIGGSASSPGGGATEGACHGSAVTRGGNCYNPKAAGAMLRRECSTEFAESGLQDREIPVPGIEKPDLVWVRENQWVNDS